MNVGVWVALIAAFSSLAVVLVKAAIDNRDKKRQQRLAEQAELRRYRALLLGAADDLGHRINNIRNQGFLVYLRADNRRDIALRSTLYRLGQYFTWTEIYREYLRLNPGRDSGPVPKTLGRITAAFASDSFDLDPTSNNPFAARLMLWREEQLAIGNLMYASKGELPGCTGFDEFTENYDKRYGRWFDTFAADLESIFSRDNDSKRLERVHALMARLIEQLDNERALVKLEGGKITEPEWAKPSQYAPLAS
jgi:hypothetical protein